MDSKDKFNESIELDEMNDFDDLNISNMSDIIQQVEYKNSPFILKHKRKLIYALFVFLILLAIIIIGGIFFIIGGGPDISSDDSSTKKKSDLSFDTEWIDKFLKLPKAENVEAFIAEYTSELHVAGSENDKKQAENTKKKFIDFGLDARIEEYKVLLSYPKDGTKVTVHHDGDSYDIPTTEPSVSGDSTSSLNFPVFNGYSGSANIEETEVVYVNYGRLEDYDVLKNNGIDVTDKIVLARYGYIFRGTKVMIAELKGAVGILIFSDPMDDGYVRGKTYPEGPWRPKEGVQRGSVEFIGLYSGDPSTPGYAGKEGVERVSNPENIPTIPSYPISANSASHILGHLGGAVVPESFKGAVVDKDNNNITYHFGPGPVTVSMNVQMDNSYGTIYDVIGTIKGVDDSKTVILGNHRDAWGIGAADPISGTGPLLELARSLGELKKKGWKPQRTITFCSWDAEEYGLVGSVEYVEDFKEKLVNEAVVYINVDMGAYGPRFDAKASPSLNNAIRLATQFVDHPDHDGKTVYDIWYDETSKVESVFPHELPLVGELGSGSDFTPFLQHIGIPSMDLEFKGDYGVYHSIYDSFHWLSTFGDPGFKYGEACTKVWGVLALLFSDSTILPFDYTEYAMEMQNYANELEREFIINHPNDVLTFEPLHDALKWFSDASLSLYRSRDHKTSDDDELDDLNYLLQKGEQQFIYEGIPGRTWYKHTIFAPGLYGGYASETFPSIRQAIDAHKMPEAQEQIYAVSSVITKASFFLLDVRFDE